MIKRCCCIYSTTLISTPMTSTISISRALNSTPWFQEPCTPPPDLHHIDLNHILHKQGEVEDGRDEGHPLWLLFFWVVLLVEKTLKYSMTIIRYLQPLLFWPTSSVSGTSGSQEEGMWPQGEGTSSIELCPPSIRNLDSCIVE